VQKQRENGLKWIGVLNDCQGKFSRCIFVREYDLHHARTMCLGRPKSIPRSAHQSESTESDTDTDSARLVILTLTYEYEIDICRATVLRVLPPFVTSIPWSNSHLTSNSAPSPQKNPAALGTSPGILSFLAAF